MKDTKSPDRKGELCFASVTSKGLRSGLPSSNPLLEKQCLLRQKIRRRDSSALQSDSTSATSSRQKEKTSRESTLYPNRLKRSRRAPRPYRPTILLARYSSPAFRSGLRTATMAVLVVLVLSNMINTVSAGGADGDEERSNLKPRISFDGVQFVHGGPKFIQETKPAGEILAFAPNPIDQHLLPVDDTSRAQNGGMADSSLNQEAEQVQPAAKLLATAKMADRVHLSALSGPSEFTSLLQTAKQGQIQARLGASEHDAVLLQQASVVFDKRGNFQLGLEAPPSSHSIVANKIVARSHQGDYVFFSLDPELQSYAEQVVAETQATHAALVMMDPKTGHILAMAQHSRSGDNLVGHAGFPAASLIKIITASAALEKKKLAPYDMLAFRGGTYTLNQWNYAANARSDTRHMSFTEALAKSCNPVFARVGSLFAPSVLRAKLENAGFNKRIPFEWDLETSRASVPSGAYEYARTSAGFGKVHISPIHAAVIMSGIANDGLLPKPSIVDEVVDLDGRVLYRNQDRSLGRFVEPEIAKTLRKMMISTTTVGTSKSEFFRAGRPVLPGISVAGKTGTLRGENPSGINNWFLGAAPANNPKIVVASVVVYPGYVSTRSSRLARQMLQKYFSR